MANKSIKDLIKEHKEEGNGNVHIRVVKEAVGENDYQDFLNFTEGREFQAFDRATNMAINFLMNNGYRRSEAKELLIEYLKREWA